MPHVENKNDELAIHNSPIRMYKAIKTHEKTLTLLPPLFVNHPLGRSTTYYLDCCHNYILIQSDTFAEK